MMCGGFFDETLIQLQRYYDWVNSLQNEIQPSATGFTVTGNWNKVKMEKEEGCPICHEKLCDIQTECNHFFCEDCITSWFEISHKCPMCREDMY
jgi:hypothetical protein